jgi:cytochrome P450
VSDIDTQALIAEIVRPGQQDPYPFYALLREHAPVCYSEALETYLLTRYRDCEQVLRHPALFPSPDNDQLEAMFPEAAANGAYRILLSSVVNSNPPQHTRIRKLASRAFTARRIDALRGYIEAYSRALFVDSRRRGA